MSLVGPGVAGRVLSKHDGIGVDICEVLVEGLDRPITIRQRANPAVVPGRDVFLTLNPDRVLIFDRD